MTIFDDSVNAPSIFKGAFSKKTLLVDTRNKFVFYNLAVPLPVFTVLGSTSHEEVRNNEELRETKTHLSKSRLHRCTSTVIKKIE